MIHLIALRHACAIGSAVICLTCQLTRASDLPQPTSSPVLTISGAITESNIGSQAVFDMQMLHLLPPRTIETSTIWTEGKQTFTGVSLDDLLDVVGAQGETIFASAINDYEVPIPVSDATPSGPIIAYERNGMPMSARDKGPLWIIYPYDEFSSYRTEVIYTRSIWQLEHLTIQ